ncbi:MAG TPA: hypothetical protein VF936_22235 [Burkholderiales bacterium]
MNRPRTHWAFSPGSGQVLAETLAAVGAVFALFGVYLLWEGKPASPTDGRLARLLLDYFDPVTASLVANYAAIAFGGILVGFGLYARFRKKA